MISAGLAVSAQAGQPKETRVSMQTLPLAVQKTIKAKAGQDKVVRILRESENGKDVFEAIIMKDGKEMAIEVGDTGAFLGMHEEAAGHSDKAETTKKH